MKEKVNILGVAFENCSKEDLLKHKIYPKIEYKVKTYIVTANPEILLYANDNADYRNKIKKANLIIADGIGVIMASKILKKPLVERIPGIELMESLLNYADQNNKSIYMYGAKDRTIKRAVINIQEKYKNLSIVGYSHGYVNDDSNVIEEIMLKQPDLIFVALGYPRQEEWISNNISQFNKGIFMGVGGSFDVLAGEVSRAPLFWQNMKLEWLYRAFKQRERFKRLRKIPFFIFLILKQRFSPNLNRKEN